ncbi:MAG: phytoene desaturase family protein [Salibacteraceae bacterium]
MHGKASVIGSGFSSLAAASVLAAGGLEVHVFEKNAGPGGRARSFQMGGFTFDMGPSWYWMPEVMEQFFNRFGRSTSDYYELKRLDPSYRVFFEDEYVDVPAGFDPLCEMFEQRERGAADRLKAFLNDAEFKYRQGMGRLVYKTGLSPLEYLDREVLQSLFRIDLFKSFRSFARQYFADPKLLTIIEFPVLFLGATPQKTPALYSLMNYADLKLGTWYPLGGMYKLVEAMVDLAGELGVEFHFNSEVNKIESDKSVILSIGPEKVKSEVLVGGADYHHIDAELTEPAYSMYGSHYWEKRVMAPSSLIFYLGINKPVNGLQHHNLFFDAPFDRHAQQIYDDPAWPDCPLFYVCAPSKTDPSVAPNGHENLFILIPIAAGLDGDHEAVRNQYLQEVLQRIEKHTGSSVSEHIVHQRSYSVTDFKNDYHAFKGNAYGLANTLNQTAFLKPKIKHKKMQGVFFTGQLTNPGPGVPPAIISGQVTADYILKNYLAYRK